MSLGRLLPSEGKPGDSPGLLCRRYAIAGMLSRISNSRRSNPGSEIESRRLGFITGPMSFVTIRTAYPPRRLRRDDRIVIHPRKKLLARCVSAVGLMEAGAAGDGEP